ncbi:IclR family transcriptional regulator [Amycolatopsis sp. cg5]|uniref:IclR family transcriptional regulator n=1 Tax=Amycolatopsis sp. cg5 TaxID=3238802 RepID=UPI0035268768
MDQSVLSSSISSRPTEGASLGAVAKALTVLNQLISDDEPLKLTELAERTGLAKATVHRLLATLLHHNMVEAGSLGYVPASHLTGKNHHHVEFMNTLRHESTAHLTELHKLTGLTSSVGILDGTWVHYANRVYGHRAIHTPSFHTDQAPSQQTAIGRVLLAYNKDFVDRDTSGRPTVLGQIRKLGIAHSANTYMEGVSCLAVPVPVDHSTTPHVALSVSGPAGAVSAAIVPLMRRIAFRISQDLRAHHADSGQQEDEYANSHPPFPRPRERRPARRSKDDL